MRIRSALILRGLHLLSFINITWARENTKGSHLCSVLTTSRACLTLPSACIVE